MALLKTANIQNGYIDDSSLFYVSNEIDERMQKTHLHDYDILVNIVGATLDVIGRVAPLPPKFPPTNITQAMALIRITSSEFLPYYVSTFLLTGYGKKQLDRLARPTGQYNINLQELQTVKIAKIPVVKQQEIQNVVLQSIDLKEKSKALYAEAEALLLHELGLDTLDLAHEPSYEATFEEMAAVGRMDAEYFQPKYEHLLERISQTGRSVRLADWVARPIQRGTQPEYSDDGDVIVINSQHVGKTHVELTDNRYTSRDFINKKAIVEPYDVLLK